MDDKQLHLQQYFTRPTWDDWERAVEKTLKGRKAESLRRTLYEGLEAEPLYAEQEVPAYLAGYPDHPPFTRGHATLERRQAGWDIRQGYDCGSVAETAAAIQADLQRGVRSLWLVPQYTRPASPGVAGLPVYSMEPLETILEPVDLTETPVSLAAGVHLLPALAALLAVARKRGIANQALIGSVYADPIGTMAACGRVDDAWPRLWKDVAEGISWCSQHAPQLQVLCCSGLPYHDAGAHAVQEIACVLATAVAAFRALEPHGLSVDEIAQRSFVQLGVDRDMFVAVAKFRAMRLLWAKVLKACGGDVGSQEVFIHACASRVTAARRDPWVNLLRNTAEGFAAAVAGADAITLAPFDRVLGVPGELSRRMASHTQLILEQEAHVGRVVDPAGGSWYVEALTEKLARAAWEQFQQIEQQGGIIETLVSGSIKAEIGATVAQKRKAAARRKEPILGVSEYANLDEETLARDPIPTLRIPAATSPPGLDVAMEKLSNVNERIEMLMAWALQGESMQSLFAALHPRPEPVEGEALARFRWAEPWEALRDASDAYLAEHERRPRVFLANLGPIPAHKARAGFAQQFFAAGGFEAISNNGFSEVEDAVQAFAESQADGVVICGTDEAYTSWVSALAPALQAHQPRFIALAGRPGEHEAAWTEAGVSHFLYLGCDALALLTDLQHSVGVGDE